MKALTMGIKEETRNGKPHVRIMVSRKILSVLESINPESISLAFDDISEGVEINMEQFERLLEEHD